MNTITFEKEELRALVIQVGARIDSLKEIQKKAGKDGNVPRVLELEEHMKPIVSGYDKLTKALYKI